MIFIMNKIYAKWIFNYLPFILLATVFFSCSEKQSTHIKQTGVERDDSTRIYALADSIVGFSGISDSISCYERLKQFNDPYLAQKYPDAVFNAHVYTFMTSKYYAQTTDSLYFQNFYNRMIKLAERSKSSHFMAYCQLFRGRHLVKCERYDEAIPLYLSILPIFQEKKDNYAVGLIYKRIGLTYLNIYNDCDSAIKYISTAFYLTSDKVDKSLCYDNLVKLYFKTQQFDSLRAFVEMIKKPVAFWRPDGNNPTWSYYHAYLYAYTDSGSVDSVMKYLNPFMSFYFGHPDEFYYRDLMLCLSSFCNSLLQKKEYHLLDSLIYITDQFESQNPEFLKLNSDFHFVCFRYYEGKQQHAEALRFLKKFNESKRLLNLDEQKNKIDLSRMSFRAEQARISERNAQIQKELKANQQLENQKIIRNTFFAGFIFLLILIAVLINRHKLKRSIEMEKMRSRLSRDLHDDIGSTLSSINIISRTAQRNLENSEEYKIKSALDKINERSQRLLDNMDDIIWNINPGNDTFEEVMSRMREYATSILEAKQIEYRFNFPKEAINCKLPMEIKNNMYLIFKEAVNNLAKYSQATLATLSLTIEDHEIVLVIQDNGIGIPTDNFKKGSEGILPRNSGGSGLRNMNQRAIEIKGELRIKSQPSKGTTLELILPRYC